MRKLVIATPALAAFVLSGTLGSTLEAYKANFDVLMTAFGEDRLIWGSNWPVSEPHLPCPFEACLSIHLERLPRRGQFERLRELVLGELFVGLAGLPFARKVVDLLSF